MLDVKKLERWSVEIQELLNNHRLADLHRQRAERDIKILLGSSKEFKDREYDKKRQSDKRQGFKSISRSDSLRVATSKPNTQHTWCIARGRE